MWVSNEEKKNWKPQVIRESLLQELDHVTDRKLWMYEGRCFNKKNSADFS